MNINNYLDATYLKTPEQSGKTEAETIKIVNDLIEEAIKNEYKLVMIRPKYVAMAKKKIAESNRDVLVGTVIGFHQGTSSIEEKLAEAQKTIDEGADELDFVINYPAFLDGKINLVKSEVFKGTQLVLAYQKTIKWIIETAALTDDEIIAITTLIKDVVISNFDQEKAYNVFVKSSTGFFKTIDNKPSGATFEAMKLIVENARPLQVKAAGGVKNYEQAKKMITLGVDRIGTSSAKQIIHSK
ncbi:MAG: deoxyribose-phosphate aldolase [Flavobacteriales bacterium]|nr:MAG: deoxyribose-phosphate aldolase [Flavobacteriales bacterium]